MTQLGKDLETVLQVIAPRGPIVLVGHLDGRDDGVVARTAVPPHYGGRIAGAAPILRLRPKGSPSRRWERS